MILVRLLLVDRQVGWIGQRAFLVSAALAKTFIELGKRQLRAPFSEVQQSDPLDGLQTVNPVAVGALDAFNEQLRRHCLA
jgi:hypothetical protein